MRIAVELSPELTRFLQQPADRVRRAGLLGAKRVAEDYVEAIRDWIDAGRSFTPRTGRLEQETGWRPTAEGAEVFSQAPYAPFLEYGTEAHLISPRAGRKALRFFPQGGGMLIRRSVQHPGTDPMPFFYADTERRESLMLASFREAVAEVMLEGRS
jgi:hypothetical protein